MKNKIKIFVSIVLASVVLLMNSGFTVSHVHCSKGGQWIIGSEMPPLNYSSQSCKKFAKKSRQIDIYQFNFEFESKFHVENETNVNVNTVYFADNYCYVFLTQKINLPEKLEYSPPLNYKSTCIIKLQQFLI